MQIHTSRYTVYTVHPHLQNLFKRLSLLRLIINPAKFQFELTTIDFLGHRVTKDGAVSLPSKVASICDSPRPVTVSSLQEFLGMLNFYQCFGHKAAALMHLLQAALKGKVPMHLVNWLLERDSAFTDSCPPPPHTTSLLPSPQTHQTMLFL